MNRTAITCTSIAALALVASTALLLAGPLDPPAGPVAPTYKTLAEVEPRTAINVTNTPGDANSMFKITAPGSYYLTRNITGVSGKHGIEIAANDVTLDLMGFELVGVFGSFDGISATIASLINIDIRNGTVCTWGDSGIDLGTTGATNCTVTDVRASENTGFGIQAGVGCAVTDCVASNNEASGIGVGFDSVVRGCVASSNRASGIAAGSSCTITGCSSSGNFVSGITASASSTITACASTSNNVNGFAITTGCTVAGCTANSNAGSGIATSTGCTISNCTAIANGFDGIVVPNSCLVLANSAASNGNGSDGANIHVTGIDNRIEGNNCISADRGIDVDSGGNIIIRNTCSGNTINWTIVANNYYGPIVDRTGVATAAVNGPAAVGTLATTDPHANFSY